MAFRRLTLAALIGALPLTLAAAETEFSEVVVKASKAQPSAVAVDKADLQALPPATSDTASLLRDVPGVTLYGAGGVSSLPAIHGMADDRVRTKVNGMDLIASCPNHMNPALSYIDPTSVGALRVYAGITPVSVGGDSIGGTIVAETPPPRFAKAGQGSLVAGEAGTFYRSNGNARGANATATFATEAFSINYAGSTAKADNYTAGGDFKNYTFTGRAGHTLPLDEVGSTAYETRNQTLGLAFRGGDHLVEAKYAFQDIPYQLYPNQRMDMLDNTAHRLNLRYLGVFDWGALEARAYHEKVDHFMDFGDDKRYWYGSASGGNNPPGGNGMPCAPVGTPACANGMPMYTTGKTTGASVKATIDVTPRDQLKVGGELQQYRLDDWWTPSGAMMYPGTFWNINDGKRDRSALFGEWERRVDPHWLTLLGARYEHVMTDAGDVSGYANTNAMASNQLRDSTAFNLLDHKKTDNNWDLSALAKYTRDPTMDVEFGLARKVRSPNLYERYSWSTWQMAALMNNFVGDGNGYFGDVNLKPEKAHTASVTLDLHGPDREWEFKATPYYTRVTDYIDAIQWNSTANAPASPVTTDQFVILRYTNQTARLAGIDLSGHAPLGKTAWGEWGLKGLLNYTDGKNLDTGGGLYNIMPLNTKLTLTHKLGGWDNGVELVAVGAKRDVSDMRNEIKTPGYSLLNLRGSYSWKQVRLDFGIENVFDRLYYLPTGGAYVGQGTTMTNPPLPNYPQWGTAVAGMGRSLYAGVKVTF